MMRKAGKAALLAIAAACVSLTSASGQAVNNPPPVVTHGSSITPLGGFVIGAIGCAAVAPMIGTAILGRELTIGEAYHTTLGCFMGPVGWLLADALFPPTSPELTPPRNKPPGPRRVERGRHFNIPPTGEARLVANELLLEFSAKATAQTRAALARDLQLTQLETQSFALTGRTLERWRIDGTRSVPETLRLIARNYPGVSAGQGNMVYLGAQTQAAPTQAGDAQYVVGKLHLLEAHRINNGDDVLVAVIDSKIDKNHPDLAGVVAEEYDAVGSSTAPHSHGTAIAGAIAAHSKLVGVAPKVKLLAADAFSGPGDSAESTTFRILKSLDWAAAKNARIVNMSFAGPPDPLLQEMILKANARGVILIAAVGNAGPHSRPLYPAADAGVIGVTATDAADKLMPQANRGPQVALAAPGVEILAAAPDGKYQVTSGTSIAAAHASGVAALLLATQPGLTPAQVRADLLRGSRRVPGARNEIGAGIVDALAVIEKPRK